MPPRLRGDVHVIREFAASFMFLKAILPSRRLKKQIKYSNVVCFCLLAVLTVTSSQLLDLAAGSVCHALQEPSLAFSFSWLGKLALRQVVNPLALIQSCVRGLRLSQPRVRGLMLSPLRVRDLRLSQPRVRGFRLSQLRESDLRFGQLSVRGVRLIQSCVRCLKLSQKLWEIWCSFNYV